MAGQEKNKVFDFDSEETRQILAALRSVVDRGGPSEPVVSGRRDSYIGPNTGTRRLNSVNTEGMEPLAERNIFDLINKSPLGWLGDVTNPVGEGNVGVGPAGLPFTAFSSKGVKSLYHGTRRRFDKFDPSKYDKSDVLGWMTHTAENPDYAGQYALGQIKGYPVESGSRIIPLHPEAQNVLDLVDPNADDISQAMAFAENKEQLKELFKRERRSLRNEDSSFGFIHSAHNKAGAKEYPIRQIAENIRLSPQTTENMPWDAIRYHDMSEKSWAFPERTPLRSQFGAPLNEAAEGKISPIKMVRSDDISTGNFPVLADYKGPVATNRVPKSITDVKPFGHYYNEAANKNKIKSWDEYIAEADLYDTDPKGKTLKGFFQGFTDKPTNLIKPHFNIGDTVSIPGTQIKNQIIKDKTDLDNVMGWVELGNSVEVIATKKAILKEPKPKTHTIQSTYDWHTGNNLLNIGTKQFPQTSMGLALAKQEITSMLNNYVITSKEAENLYKALKKYKPQGKK